jgi:hypothetical protein
MITLPPSTQIPEKIIRCAKEPWSCGIRAPWIGRDVGPLLICHPSVTIQKVAQGKAKENPPLHPTPITVWYNLNLIPDVSTNRSSAKQGMNTLIQALAAKPAISLRAKTCACVVRGEVSSGSQKASRRRVFRRVMRERLLKRPKRSARLVGTIRLMIELPLEGSLRLLQGLSEGNTKVLVLNCCYKDRDHQVDIYLTQNGARLYVRDRPGTLALNHKCNIAAPNEITWRAAL